MLTHCFGTHHHPGCSSVETSCSVWFFFGSARFCLPYELTGAFLFEIYESMKRLFFWFTLLAGFTMVACKHEAGPTPQPPVIIPPVVEDQCDPDSVYFQNQVLPLLISSCGVTGCHDAGTATEGVVLVDYASVIQTGKVRAGNANDSELYEVLTDDDPEDRMPPSDRQPLTQEQIAMIGKWINQGAKNNACDAGCDTVAVSFAAHIQPLMQNNCAGCHSGASPSGGIGLTNYNEIAAAANGGRLLGAIRQDAGFSPMPQNGNKLNICQITQVKKWIENGTPQN